MRAVSACAVGLGVLLPGAQAHIDGTFGPYTVGAFLRPSKERLKALAQRAMEVTNPKSPHWGHYYTQDEIVKAVGISEEEAERASAWLRDAIGVVNGSHPSHRVLAHRDALSATVSNFHATWRLGVGLAGVAVEGGSAPKFPPTPKSMELLVTPPMPPDYCSQFQTEDHCDLRRPCKWKPAEKKHKDEHKKKHEHKHNRTNATDEAEPQGEKRHEKKEEAHKPSGTCDGEFDGWVCWSEEHEGSDGVPRWHCFEPRNLVGVNGSMTSKERFHAIWRQRRRGRRVDMAEHHRRQNRRKDAPPVPKAEAYGDLGFRVSPQSRGIAITYDSEARAQKSKETGSWKTVEITYRQLGVFFTRVVRREEFNGTVQQARFLAAHLSGMHNLEIVDKIAVCINDPGSAVDVTVSAAAAAALGQAGCECDLKTQRDRRLGRPCDQLNGFAPAFDPVDFVLPRQQQTLNALLRDLNIPKGRFADAPGVRLAVGEFSFQTFMQEDIETIRKAYGLGKLTKNVRVVGKHNQPGELTNFSTSGEGSLDLQIASILSPKSHLTWWSVSPYDMDGFMIAYVAQVNDAVRPPLVHSISWGSSEALYPPAFVNRIDYELMKIALRGITIIVASGDNGISATGASCTFASDLVGSSPWITSVGASMPSLGSAPYCAEPVAELLGACDEPGPITCSTLSGAVITSAGYWSIYRAQPWWQAKEVDKYLQKSDCAPCNLTGANRVPTSMKTPCQHINGKKGCDLSTLLGKTRASPDVAVPGSSFPTFVNATLGILDGTSASAPVMGALCALMNAEQRNRKQPPLGLLNPWIYGLYEDHPGAFADVSVGDIGATEEHQCAMGFKAAPGWDPATGVGVPRFLALRRLMPTANGSIRLPPDEDAREQQWRRRRDEDDMDVDGLDLAAAAADAPAAADGTAAAAANVPGAGGSGGAVALFGVVGALAAMAVAGAARAASRRARSPRLLLEAASPAAGPSYHAWPPA